MCVYLVCVIVHVGDCVCKCDVCLLVCVPNLINVLGFFFKLKIDTAH